MTPVTCYIKEKSPGCAAPGAEGMSFIKQAQAEENLPDKSAYSQEIPILTLSMFIIPHFPDWTDGSVTSCLKLVKSGKLNCQGKVKMS